MAAKDSPSGAPSTEHEELKRLGKYEIQKRLGAGGMGTVFLALDGELKRTVALKVLPKDRAENPTLVKRFKAEGHAAAYLQHKNIVGVYEAGQIDGFLFIALEYIDGTDVLDMIKKRGIIPVKRSVAIVTQVAEALNHAYEKQIVHRDIKPSNLLIKRDGSVKLADLGLARSIDDTLDTSITRAGTTVGTVDYMSPEQARNSKAADIRSDIYSLGCTWYHMLTGFPPFPDGSMTNKLQAHAITPAPDPRDLNPRIPEGVVATIHRMMAKKQADRYQTPAELLEDLRNPAMTRTVLNVDVLAALAAPDQDEESVDVDNQFDGEDAASSAEPSVETPLKPKPVDDPGPPARRKLPPREALPEADAPEPTRRQFKKLPDERTLPPRMPIARSEPDESRADEPAMPARSADRASKKRAASKAAEQNLPNKTANQAARESTRESLKSKPSHKGRPLPPRSDQPVRSDSISADEPAFSIDPGLLKNAIVAAILVAALVAVGFAVSRMGGSSEGAGKPAFNPDGKATTAATPTETSEVKAWQPGPVDPSSRPGVGNGAQTQAEIPAESTTNTTARKNAAPLAGAEDLDLNGSAGRELIGDWLFSVRQAPATSSPIVVHRGASDGAVRSLAAALEAIPQDDAVIEFDGDGPFRIPATTLPSRQRLTLRGHGESRPVLVLSAADLKAGEGCLTMPEGTLVLENLHLILPAATANATMISAAAVSVRNVSITVAGVMSAPAVAIDLLQGNASNASGCVLENCIIRGDSLTAVRLSSERSNLFAGNCLLISGTSPTISASPTAESAARELTLFGSTVLTSHGVFDLKHAPSDQAAPIRLAAQRTAFVSQGDNQTAWLTAASWPAGLPEDLNHPIAAGLSWKGDRNAFIGWQKLVHFQSRDGHELDAVDDHGWKQFWRNDATTVDVKPPLPSLPERLSTISPATMTETLEAAGANRTGCVAASLAVPPNGVFNRVLAVSARRQLPTDFFAFQTPVQTVDFNLAASETLEAFLNDPSKCPDGTLVRLKGNGIKTFPPLKIQNRSLHLEFVQADAGAAPLTVRPQVSPGDAPAEAWIRVEGGAIDLIGARLNLLESERQPYPRSLLLADGDVAIRKCQLVGPSGKSSKPGPLIRWTAAANVRPGAAFIENSLLAGGAPVLEAALADRLLEVNNSVLAGIDDVIVASSTATNSTATIAVLGSTIAPRSAAFRLDNKMSAAQFNVFLSNSVYAPTFPSDSQSPTVLALPENFPVEQISWWEDGIGYGSQIKQLLSINSIPAISAGDAAAWQAKWGDGHVLRPLFDPRGVALDRALPELDKVDPGAFTMSANSMASDWKATGGPIGAQVDQVGPPKPDAGKPDARPPDTAPGNPHSMNPGF
jgi:serine/threonine-protein kinase